MLTRESVFLDGSLGGEAQAESWLVVSPGQSAPGNRAHAHALSLSFFVCVCEYNSLPLNNTQIEI